MKYLEKGLYKLNHSKTDTIFIALSSTIQASWHKPQPTQYSALIVGFSHSKLRAPSTVQDDAHAPHSGPEKGKQVSVLISARANLGKLI